MARCVECDSVYTAWVWETGAVRFAGSGSCPCGSNHLVVIDELAARADEFLATAEQSG